MLDKLTVGVLASALVLVHWSAPVHAGTPLAVMLRCEGPVRVIQTGGKKVDGGFGLHLNAGDRIETGAGASAEILFESNNLIQIGPNSGLAVGKTGEGSGSRLGEGSYESVQKFLKLKDGTSIAQLRSGTTGSLEAVAPRQTRIREVRPTLRWIARDPAIGLRVTVYDEGGVHWQQDVTGVTEITYPVEAPPLAPGVEYSWTLESTDPLLFPPLRSPAAFFRVIDEEEAAKLDQALEAIDEANQQSDLTQRLRRASVFYEFGLVDEAIEETHKAIESEANDPILHTILAQLYAAVGRTADALGEYDRLLDHK